MIGEAAVRIIDIGEFAYELTDLKELFWRFDVAANKAK